MIIIKATRRWRKQCLLSRDRYKQTTGEAQVSTNGDGWRNGESSVRTKHVRQSLTHRYTFENDRRGLPRHTDAIPRPSSRPVPSTTAEPSQLRTRRDAHWSGGLERGRQAGPATARRGGGERRGGTAKDGKGETQRRADEMSRVGKTFLHLENLRLAKS